VRPRRAAAARAPRRRKAHRFAAASAAQTPTLRQVMRAALALPVATPVGMAGRTAAWTRRDVKPSGDAAGESLSWGWRMRATKGYVAGAGTTSALVGAIGCAFALLSAVVAVHGWPLTLTTPGVQTLDGRTPAGADAFALPDVFPGVGAFGRSGRDPAGRPQAAARPRTGEPGGGAGPFASAFGSRGSGRAQRGGAGARAASPSPTRGAGPSLPRGTGSGSAPPPGAGAGGTPTLGSTITQLASGAATVVAQACQGLGGALQGATAQLGGAVGQVSPTVGQAVVQTGQVAGGALGGATGAAGQVVSGAGTTGGGVLSGLGAGASR